MTRIRRKLRQLADRLVTRLFPLFERLGYHIMPVHFYSPIPKLSELPERIFDQKSDCIGLTWNEKTQLNCLTEVFPKYASEFLFPENQGIGRVDAAILHSMIRHHQPKKIIEIGAGVSTQISSIACDLNRKSGKPCEFVSIEPYLNDHLRKSFPTSVTLIEKKVQEVPTSAFRDCDLLFIDSSHVVKIGSDVNYEILEILPLLKKGALVHFHDILLPGEYWPEWIKECGYFWSEQYLLHAFLLFNSDFEIIWGSRYMHLNHGNKIKNAFPFFNPEKNRISSFWIRRV